MMLRIFFLYYGFILSVTLFLEFFVLLLCVLLSGMMEAVYYSGGATLLSIILYIYMQIRIVRSSIPLARQIAIWLYPIGGLSVLAIAGYMAYAYYQSLIIPSLNPILMIFPGLTVFFVIIIKAFEIRFLTDYEDLKDRLERPATNSSKPWQKPPAAGLGAR